MNASFGGICVSGLGPLHVAISPDSTDTDVTDVTGHVPLIHKAGLAAPGVRGLCHWGCWPMSQVLPVLDTGSAGLCHRCCGQVSQVPPTGDSSFNAPLVVILGLCRASLLWNICIANLQVILL